MDKERKNQKELALEKEKEDKNKKNSENINESNEVESIWIHKTDSEDRLQEELARRHKQNKTWVTQEQIKQNNEESIKWLQEIQFKIKKNLNNLEYNVSNLENRIKNIPKHILQPNVSPLVLLKQKNIKLTDKQINNFNKLKKQLQKVICVFMDFLLFCF